MLNPDGFERGMEKKLKFQSKDVGDIQKIIVIYN